MLPIAPPNYSARDTAITQRPTSTAILAIDSEDRYKTVGDSRNPPPDLSFEEFANNPIRINTTPWYFSIDKAQSLNNGFFTRLGVTEVNIPWSIPNINSRTQSILFFYQNAPAPVAFALITIPVGFYTPSQLAAALQAAVRLAVAPLAATFTMTYGAGNYPAFNYATNLAGWTCGWSYIATGVPLPSGFSLQSDARQLFDVLGFDSSHTDLTPGSTGGVTYAQSVRYIDIVCTQLTYNQALKDTASQTVNRDVLCRVYITEPGSIQSTVSPSSATFCPPGCAPTTIYRDFSQPKQIQWLPNQPVTGQLVFEVFDDRGVNLAYSDPATIDSANKLDWSMTMLLTEN